MDKVDCEALRRELKPIAEKLWLMRGRMISSGEVYPTEQMANMTLAYRHLEDASMRLGKAIQALDGGVSVYDKDQVPKSG